MEEIKFFDWFAWIWGFHLALKNAKWEDNIKCVWYSEIDNNSIKTYEKNFPGSKNYWDITKIDIDSLPYFNLLTWGFPCQDVSVAWNMNLEWWRTVLVEYLLQIMEKKKPKYCVFENVKWILSNKFEEFFSSIQERMMNAWYTVLYEVLNSSNFWLPQNRDRVFIIAIRNDPYEAACFNIPKWSYSPWLIHILEKEVDESLFVSQEQQRKLSLWTCDFPELWKILIRNATNRWYLEANEWDGVNLSFPNSKTRRWRVQYWKSWTLTCNDLDWVVVRKDWKLQLRKFSPIERERLQWFPDNWTDGISYSWRCSQTWNAISVNIATAIFKNLLK